MPGTVTVACRLPHGLILRVFDMVETQEPVMGGGYRAVKVAQEREQRAQIRGFSHPQNAAPTAQLVEGFALTPNVDKDLWEVWKVQNAQSAMMKNGLIFAHEKTINAEAESKEKAKVKSGLERLDPERLPRGIQKSDYAKKN